MNMVIGLQCIIVVLPLLWSFSNACEVNQKCDVDLNDPNIKNLVSSIQKFSFEVLNIILPEDVEKNNVVCSPMSMYIVLILISIGAAGNTQTEIIAALGFQQTDLPQFQASLIQILNALNVKRTIKDANSQEVVVEEVRFPEGFFIQEGFTLVEEYSKYVTQITNVEIQNANFANDLQGANQKIADWINKNNPGRDRQWVWATASATTKILLANVIYFSVNWMGVLFVKENIKSATFNGMNGPKEIPMMSTVKELLYYDDTQSFTAVQLPYDGDNFMMMIILPNENSDSVEFVRTFTADKYQAIIDKSQKKMVNCVIPKIEAIPYAVNLGEKLGKLNIKELFTQADLSKMLANTGQEKFAAESFHAAVLSIDENGSMVVGVSSGAGEAQSQSTNSQDPILFNANRPYIAIIRNVKTNIILMASFIQNLEAKN